jgi:mannose-6-phosphate isomerase-like protein (cupin superfamily)
VSGTGSLRTWNLRECCDALPGAWKPARVATVNDHDLKVAILEGEFEWHHHEDTDECFVVLDGELVMHLRDGDRRMGAGELIVIPKGVEHKPCAAQPCRVLLLEKTGTLNTGSLETDRTVRDVPDIESLL